ncbi:toxin-antitoxin system HicB family antitoxin [Nonomuraea sp. NPDC049649]|uniref:toxin-antitoxin system HicB family antitoxin n=1 Tax=Nonomuraea sp. NPDC049649 TaxID=3155776 RepID=UPI00342CFEF5
MGAARFDLTPTRHYDGVMIRITLRLPDDVHARVVARAETERRSLNSQIVHLLEIALAADQSHDESP